MKEYFSISEAAEFLHVTTRTLKNWRKSGRLKPVKTSENGYGYYSYDQLVKIPKLVKSNTQTSESSEIQSSENFQTSERGEIITSEKTSESSESSENLTSETSEIFLQTSENQTSEIIQTSEISPLQTSESSETGVVKQVKLVKNIKPLTKKRLQSPKLIIPHTTPNVNSISITLLV